MRSGKMKRTNSPRAYVEQTRDVNETEMIDQVALTSAHQLERVKKLLTRNVPTVSVAAVFFVHGTAVPFHCQTALQIR